MQEKWGIVGLGMLGTALIEQWVEQKMTIGVYHPDRLKAKAYTAHYNHTYVLDVEDLAALDVLIVALPAGKIDAFMQDVSERILSDGPLLVNMATTYPTDELEKKYPNGTWMGMKCMAHAEDVRKYGNELFVTEEPLPTVSAAQKVLDVFSSIGHVIMDRESVVAEVNKLATYHGIKAVKELEKDMRDKGYRSEYERQAISSITSEVIRFYVRGQLGHFAKEVARRFDEEE